MGSGAAVGAGGIRGSARAVMGAASGGGPGGRSASTRAANTSSEASGKSDRSKPWNTMPKRPVATSAALAACGSGGGGVVGGRVRLERQHDAPEVRHDFVQLPPKR